MAKVFDFVNAHTIVESLWLYYDDKIVTAKLIKQIVNELLNLMSID